MSEWKPVRTKAELELLDDDEIVEGYRDGWDNAEMPGSDKSRSFWHGWRNAQVDKGRVQSDAAQIQLAREIVGKYRGLN